MSQLEQFKLLAECYKSDLSRLEMVKEGAWYFIQLPVDDSINEVECMKLIEDCKREEFYIKLKLRDLEILIKDLEAE